MADQTAEQAATQGMDQRAEAGGDASTGVGVP